MLEFLDVTKRFGVQSAVSGVTFSLTLGETAALMGPSGCGKTTILRLAAGLDAPSSGEIRIAGSPASVPEIVLQAPHLRGISCVFQEPRLWPHLSVRGNIAFTLPHLPKPERIRRIAKVADWTGLSSLLDRRPANLSGGEARRAALARALAPSRPVLLMDEPFANLDADASSRILDSVLAAQSEDGFALLVVSHNLEEIRSLHARVLAFW